MLILHYNPSNNAIPNVSSLKVMTSMRNNLSLLRLLTDRSVAWATEAQDRLQELEFLRKIRDQSSEHPGHTHVLQLKDHFYHQSLRGRYLCVATEPLFQNMYIFSMRFPHRIMPLRLVRSLARQIVLGTQYLHDECNIIHTGKHHLSHTDRLGS